MAEEAFERRLQQQLRLAASELTTSSPIMDDDEKKRRSSSIRSIMRFQLRFAGSDFMRMISGMIGPTYEGEQAEEPQQQQHHDGSIAAYDAVD
jgi:hypothetical protein